MKSILNYLTITFFLYVVLFLAFSFGSTRGPIPIHSYNFKFDKEHIIGVTIFPNVLFLILLIFDPFTKWDKLDKESAEKLHLQTEEMTNLRIHVSEFVICFSCGYQPYFLPWGEDGQSPSMGICPCCGVQFGNEDKTLDSLKAYRSKWISKGARWFSKEDKPEGWDMEVQMQNIPEEFL